MTCEFGRLICGVRYDGNVAGEVGSFLVESSWVMVKDSVDKS